MNCYISCKNNDLDKYKHIFFIKIITIIHFDFNPFEIIK